ncbi:MAG: hypothetical protein ABSE13_08705 [Methanoregula sp.]|jgi:hypothetical protein
MGFTLPPHSITGNLPVKDEKSGSPGSLIDGPAGLLRTGKKHGEPATKTNNQKNSRALNAAPAHVPAHHSMARSYAKISEQLITDNIPAKDRDQITGISGGRP